MGFQLNSIGTLGKCANECFEKGEMSRSQKQAVITLIEKKKSKNHPLQENWLNIFIYQ